MADDATFRWVMIAGFVAVIAVLAPYRLKAATREKLDRSREGVVVLATLRPAGAALWISVLLFMINPALMAWSSLPLPATWRWGGAVLCALSGTFLLWTLPALGRNLTDTVVTRQEATLVTQGPYRWIRHPFYDAVALAMVGSALIAANWFILTMGAAVFALLAIRLRVEEELLAVRFGDAYRAYQSRTGRFLPRGRSWRRQ